jgi:hypothetical protein
VIEDRSLSSAPPSWLDGAYPSSQKGGTVIAEWVVDLETHEACLDRPDRYRPEGCGRCGAKVHVHDTRSRQMRGDPTVATEVIRFRCADRDGCGATWSILPGFLARRLWRSWRTVAAAVAPGGRCEPVPSRTRRRWKAGLARPARALIVILTTACGAISALATTLGLDALRIDVLVGYRREIQPDRDRSLAELAGLIHRLSPGVRLM